MSGGPGTAYEMVAACIFTGQLRYLAVDRTLRWNGRRLSSVVKARGAGQDYREHECTKIPIMHRSFCWI